MVKRSAAEVRREIARVELTTVERVIYNRLVDAAEAEQAAPSIEELSVAISASSPATVPGIMRRIEAKGYITRDSYQRGRTVCITATGKCTVPPPCTVPHWRKRDRAVPIPTIQAVRQREPEIAVLIEREARTKNQPLSDLLADLVFNGWRMLEAMKENDRDATNAA